MVRKVRGTDLVISDMEENISSRSVGRSLEVGWTDDDARWGNPPCLPVPTLVKTMVEIVQIQNLDTVPGPVNVHLEGPLAGWKEQGRSAAHPPLVSEARHQRGPWGLHQAHLRLLHSCRLYRRRHIHQHLARGNHTELQDLHIFPLDTDSVEVTFTASECYKRSGEVNVNYKSDYRMYFYFF